MIAPIILFLLSIIGASNQQPIAPACKINDNFELPENFYDKNPHTENLGFKFDDEFHTFRDPKSNIVLAIHFCCDCGEWYIFPSDQIPEILVDYFAHPGFFKETQVKNVSAMSRTYIQKKVDFALHGESKYFVSNKGVTLGLCSKKITGILGPPDSKKIIKKKPLVTRYVWEYFDQVEIDTMIKLGKVPPTTDKVCPDKPGQKIIIDFISKKKGDEAIFINYDHHCSG